MTLLLALGLFAAADFHADIHVSKTAQIFHIVDQLSNWSPYCHAQYRREFRLDAKDEALLKEHASLRQLQGYGLLDRAFYFDSSLAAAIDSLPKHDRDIEARVLKHFEPMLAPFIAKNEALLALAVTRVEKELAQMQTFTTEVARFFGNGQVTVPIYLVPSIPGSNGGGFNGDRLTIEVSPMDRGLDERSLVKVLTHETWHAFAKAKRTQIGDAARKVLLDETTLSEGFAYAAVPGIYGSGELNHLGSWDDTYVRFNRLGAALVPSLRDALRDGVSFETYLPVAIGVYRGLQNVEARANAKPRFFCFGAEVSKHGRVLVSQGFDTWMRPMTKSSLDELRPKMTKSDVVVLALSRNERLPDEYRALMLDKTGDLETSMQQHESGTWSGHWSDRKIAVVWAKDDATLSAIFAGLPRSM